MSAPLPVVPSRPRSDLVVVSCSGQPARVGEASSEPLDATRTGWVLNTATARPSWDHECMPDSKFNLDLDAAWKRVVNEASSDAIPDVLRFDDQKLGWDTLKADIISQLDSGAYHPATPRLVEVPKDEFSSRPITVMRVADRIIYEALVDRLIPAIESALPDAVYSARVKVGKTGKSRMPHQIQQWLRFQRAGRKLCDEETSAFMLSTDVSSYFEYVDLATLMKELKALPGVDPTIVDLLSRFLNDFERTTDIWGLPQGPTASSILGNFYLLPVDRYLSMQAVKHIRFQDDIKIFSESPSTLRKVLRECVRILRGRHLNFSVHKTKLLEGDEIIADFEDSIKDAIQYGIKVDADSVSDDLHALFDQATSMRPVSSRDVRFVVVRLAERNDPYAVGWILDHLSEVPYLASHLVSYLSKYFVEMPEIETRLVAFLEDPMENSYPHTELHLVRLMATAKQIEDDTYSSIWRILNDAARPVYIREHAARCIGRHARPGDLALIKSAFVGETDNSLRRALLVAATEAGGSPDKSWLSSVAGSEPYLKPACDFLASRAKLPPP
jgi:hypothetical protein